jgi:TatD DNase family protein
MKPISLFDTHCHIDFSHFDADRDEVFARMQQAGVERIVAVSVELNQAAPLTALAESKDNVWFSVGSHPNHEEATEPAVEQICTLANHPRCVAIGETGMDFFHRHVEPAIQEQRFRNHIRAAKQSGKPVIVHMREADEATLRVMREEKIADCGGIMHCFSSSRDIASRALDMGMSIAFSGNVTYKRNQALRDVARQVPDDRLLIETDAPYLAPIPHRGKRNEPTYVRDVAECIAAVRGVDLEALAALTTRNALSRFNLQE